MNQARYINCPKTWYGGDANAKRDNEAKCIMSQAERARLARAWRMVQIDSSRCKAKVEQCRPF